MSPQNFTTKSQEAIQMAHQIATSNGQQAVDPIHLITALLEQEDGVVAAILKKLQTDLSALKGTIEHALAHVPKGPVQQGGVGQIFLSPDTMQLLVAADKAAKQFKDEYISTEHLLLGLLRDRAVGRLLAQNKLSALCNMEM